MRYTICMRNTDLRSKLVVKIGSEGPNRAPRGVPIYAPRWPEKLPPEPNSTLPIVLSSSKESHNHTLNDAHVHYWPQVTTCWENRACRSNLVEIRCTNACTKETQDVTPQAQFALANSGKQFKVKLQPRATWCACELLTLCRNCCEIGPEGPHGAPWGVPIYASMRREKWPPEPNSTLPIVLSSSKESHNHTL
jgi:hypothetical protein